MRLPRLLNLNLLPLLLLFAAQKVGAQLAPADDFFNSGAQSYISNNIPAAKERVEAGLKIYPDDAKLKKLEELLKQQQQSQNSQSQPSQQNQSQQQQSKNNQQSQEQPKPDSQDQAGQKKDEQQKKAEQQKSSAGKKDGEKPEDKNAEGQPVAPGQMTPEEAKRLLDAQKGSEQLLTLKPQGKPENNNRPVKDW